MKYFLLIFFSICALDGFSQKTITIKTLYNNGPIPGVSILINGVDKGATDLSGKLTAVVNDNDQITINSTVYENVVLTFNSNMSDFQNDELTIHLKLQARNGKNLSSVSSASIYSGITGSMIFNAFDESEINDLISTVTMKLGSFDLSAFDIDYSETSKFQLNLIGTLSDFSEQKKEDISKNLIELSQQNLGLQVGLQPVYHIRSWTEGKDTAVFRFYGGLIAKYNAFTLADSSSVGLPQFRVTAGFEFEGIPLINQNKPINIHLYYYRNMFSESRYNEVFESKRNHIQGIEGGIIVPISNLLGFKLGVTVSSLFEPVWNGGIVFWPSE